MLSPKIPVYRPKGGAAVVLDMAIGDRPVDDIAYGQIILWLTLRDATLDFLPTEFDLKTVPGPDLSHTT